MPQSGARTVTIQIHGKTEQDERHEEIASIIRLLQFASEETDAFGYDDCSEKIRNAIDDLNRHLNGTYN